MPHHVGIKVEVQIITIIAIFISLGLHSQAAVSYFETHVYEIPKVSINCVEQILSKNGHWALCDFHACSDFVIDYAIGLLSQGIKK